MSRSIARKGFTLLELMISLVLLSVLLAAIYSVFFMSHKAINGIDDSLLKLQESRMTLDIMAREAEAAVLSSDNKDTFRVEDRDFYGKQASRFTFTAFSPRTGGLAAVSYYVEEKKGDLILYKKMRSAFRPDDGSKGSEIIEGVSSFLVEIENSGKWLKTWDAAETKKLPDKIRLTITFKLNDRQVTIYEIASPMIGKNI